MATLTVPQLIAASAESHATLLGEDFIGWRVAIIVAFVALIVWEIVTALTRTVSLRLPFLVLYTTRLFMPKDEWKAHYKRWKADLWFVLDDRDRHWIIRFAKGMIFAVPLALRGGRLTAKASRESAVRARSSLRRRRFSRYTGLLLIANYTASTIGLVRTVADGGPFYLFAAPMAAAGLALMVWTWRRVPSRAKSKPEE